MKKVFVKFFAKFFEVFAKFFKVFASFLRFSRAFRGFRIHSDPLGCIRMHSEAIGSVSTFSKIFEIFWIFESFFNVSGRNFYKRLFSRHNNRKQSKLVPKTIENSAENDGKRRRNEAFEFDSSCQALGLAVRVEFKCYGKDGRVSKFSAVSANAALVRFAGI